MEVIAIDGTDPEWDRFVRASRRGTIFHTLKFLSYHPPSRFDFEHLAIKESGRLVCVIPGGRLDMDGRTCYRSPLGASFGGFVFGEAPGLKAVFEAIAAFVEHVKRSGFAAVEITMPPACYYGCEDQVVAFAMTSLGFELRSREATAVVPLEAVETDNLAPSLRRNLRKAEASGVTVRTGKSIRPFYDVLARNLAAKGATPTHSADELEGLAGLFPDRILLFEAWLDQGIAGGCFTFICNSTTALAFYICDDPDLRRFRVAEFVLHGCLSWFKQRGYRYLDLGTVSTGGQVNWGLARFKSKFMAETFVRETYVLELKG
jgi:hypothetical protein